MAEKDTCTEYLHTEALRLFGPKKIICEITLKNGELFRLNSNQYYDIFYKGPESKFHFKNIAKYNYLS